MTFGDVVAKTYRHDSKVHLVRRWRTALGGSNQFVPGTVWIRNALGELRCRGGDRSLLVRYTLSVEPESRVTCSGCLRDLRRRIRHLMSLDSTAFYAGEKS